MKLGSLHLNLLVAFEALADVRSVSRAAERLGIRQPAMSAALARLRILFEDELFVRAAGAMQPTPRALQIAPGITKALAQLRATLDENVPFAPSNASQLFRIASTDYTTFVLIPPLMERIAREAPRVSLQIVGYDKGDVAASIDRGEIDLALGVFKQPPERAVLRTLCAERFVGVARQGHPAIIDGTMTLDAYVAASHAMVSVRRDLVGEIDAVLTARGLSRRTVLTLPHMLALPAILLRGDLIAALPARVTATLGNRALQTFPLPIPVSSWNIQMLWNPVARDDRAHGWLRALVATVAQTI